MKQHKQVLNPISIRKWITKLDKERCEYFENKSVKNTKILKRNNLYIACLELFSIKIQYGSIFK